jgi:predicted Rossmann fold flavoprotein
MADCDFLHLLKEMGYPTVKMSPSIVQLRSDDEQNILKQLSGIKVRARATLMRGSEKIRSEFGEVMFRDYGLSGPAIMQLAREVGRKTGNYAVYLDLMPEYDFETLWHMLSHRAVAMSDRTMTEFLTGMLNKRPGQVILKLLGFKLSDRAALLTEPQIKQLANLIKNLRIDIFDTADFKHSQVTAGGLDTDSFDDKTMMSKRDDGLFAVGEILDIDGDCGGFNLQWAWSSACCAADSVIQYITKEK